MKSKVIGHKRMFQMDYLGLPYIYKVATLMNRFLNGSYMAIVLKSKINWHLKMLKMSYSGLP